MRIIARRMFSQFRGSFRLARPPLGNSGDGGGYPPRLVAGEQMRRVGPIYDRFKFPSVKSLLSFSWQALNWSWAVGLQC